MLQAIKLQSALLGLVGMEQVGICHHIFCLLLLQSVSFLTLFADEKRPLPNVKHMIDTHIHLYNTSREGGVPWPPEDDKVLYKPHLPKEFEKVSKSTGLTGVIVVEASHLMKDNKWVLKC